MSKRERIEALEARVAALEASNAAGGLEDASDNTPGGDMCEAAHASGLVCTLDLDHDGQHVATGGPGMVLQTWTDLEPDAEVIDAQIVCGASRIIDGVMRYCDSGADHDGEHVSEGRARRTWTDPEPVPQWRALVDSWAENGVMDAEEDPLAAVLWSLHWISLLQGVDKREVADALARIVTVCEGQVGDGWKADPGRVPHGHWGIAWLLAPLSHEPPDWVVVADRAAAWLRSLTDGAS